MKQKYSLNEMQDLIRNQIPFKHNKIEAYYDNKNNYQVRYNYNLIFKYDLVNKKYYFDYGVYQPVVFNLQYMIKKIIGINNTERKVYVGDL